MAIAVAPNVRTSAIYYFITALFVLLACFDTYFALPLNLKRKTRFLKSLWNTPLKKIDTSSTTKKVNSIIHLAVMWVKSTQS